MRTKTHVFRLSKLSCARACVCMCACTCKIVSECINSKARRKDQVCDKQRESFCARHVRTNFTQALGKSYNNPLRYIPDIRYNFHLAFRIIITSRFSFPLLFFPSRYKRASESPARRAANFASRFADYYRDLQRVALQTAAIVFPRAVTIRTMLN